jgi:hypothetical protein
VPFDLGKSFAWSTVKSSSGEATYSPFDYVLVGDQAIPRKILFRSGGGSSPWLTMGIEVVGDVPECTYLELDADNASGPVRDKHLKLVHIEKWVSEIVAKCAQQVVQTSEKGDFVMHGPTTPEQVKTVQRLQRRRRDPNDTELLERVAAIYKANPDAPVAAIMRAMDMSRRTAGRWASRCSENGLLPSVDAKGKKRL